MILHLWRDGDITRRDPTVLEEYVEDYCRLIDQLAFFKAKTPIGGVRSYIDYIQIRLDHQAGLEYVQQLNELRFY